MNLPCAGIQGMDAEALEALMALGDLRDRGGTYPGKVLAAG